MIWIADAIEISKTAMQGKNLYVNITVVEFLLTLLEGFDEDNYLDNLTLFLVLPTCINKLVLTSARDLKYCWEVIQLLKGSKWWRE